MTKLTVWRGLQEGLGRPLLAAADVGQEFLPIADDGEVLRAELDRAVAALVETVENGDRQAAVEAMALGDDLAVLDDGLGHSVDGLFEKRVGELGAGDLARRVPAGGEQGIAGAKGVGGLLRQLRPAARLADPPGLGERLEEEAAGEGRPAVAAAIVRPGAADDMRQCLRIAPERVDEGFEVLVG